MAARDTTSGNLIGLLLLLCQFLLLFLSLRMASEMLLILNALVILQTHIVQSQTLILLKCTAVLLNGHCGIWLRGIQVLKVGVAEGVVQDQCALDLERQDLLQLVQELCKHTTALRLVLRLGGYLARKLVVHLAQKSFHCGESPAQCSGVQFQINLWDR